MNLIKELVKIYRFKSHHVTPLTKKQSTKYFTRALKDGSIYYKVFKKRIIAYVEVWRLSFRQLEKLTLKTFDYYNEDICSGDICYVADLYIDPDFRHTGMIREMKKELFDTDFRMIAGKEAKRNRLRIFKRR